MTTMHQFWDICKPGLRHAWNEGGSNVLEEENFQSYEDEDTRKRIPILVSEEPKSSEIIFLDKAELSHLDPWCSA